ncbi:MAG TPA: transposase [Magnetococcales bacterium]|nr:transposase [Magnetococcales bacterium]
MNGYVEAIKAKGAQSVIPQQSNQLNPRGYDRHWYKNRNLVERFFNKIEQFRRIATRYKKLDGNFMGMILLACTMIWLPIESKESDPVFPEDCFEGEQTLWGSGFHGRGYSQHWEVLKFFCFFL